MSRKMIVEVWVGLFTVLAFVALLMVAFKVSNFQGVQKETYQIKAAFSNIGGLKVRAPVKISGVIVGKVIDIEVDKETYQAIVVMAINSDLNHLSLDTSASILTSGMLGDQYIGIDPGADEEYLQDGDYLDIVQPALVLEELIGKFLTNLSGE
jgi:phospholipid/cholesterol/gamma-HCH transport system substrate-binding protein